MRTRMPRWSQRDLRWRACKTAARPTPPRRRKGAPPPNTATVLLSGGGGHARTTLFTRDSATLALSPLLACALAALTAPVAAFTINIAAGNPRTVYLQVGVGDFSANYIAGGNPRNNSTIDTVTVTVPAAQVGSGVAQTMTTNSTVGTSFYDGRAFCTADAQLYIGGFYRSVAAGGAATVRATVPANLVNATGETIPFSQISWTSSDIGDFQPTHLRPACRSSALSSATSGPRAATRLVMPTERRRRRHLHRPRHLHAVDAMKHCTLALLLTLAAGCASAATFRVDDSASVPAESNVRLKWRDLVPGRRPDNTLEGAVGVAIRLNLAPSVNPTARCSSCCRAADRRRACELDDEDGCCRELISGRRRGSVGPSGAALEETLTLESKPTATAAKSIVTQLPL